MHIKLAFTVLAVLTALPTVLAHHRRCLNDHDAQSISERWLGAFATGGINTLRGIVTDDVCLPILLLPDLLVINVTAPFCSINAKKPSRPSMHLHQPSSLFRLPAASEALFTPSHPTKLPLLSLLLVHPFSCPSAR